MNMHTHDCGKSISDTVPICPGCGDWNTRNAVGAQKRAAGVSVVKSTTPKTIGDDLDAFNAEQITWLDGIAKEQGIARARALAEFNGNTVWAKAWLTKNAEAVQKSDAETVRKSAEVALEKAAADVEAIVKRRGPELGLRGWAVIGELVAKGDPEMTAALEAHERAKLAAASAVTGGQLEAIDAEIEKLTGEEESDVEKFAVQHNLAPSQARDRLLSISKTAAARAERVRDLYGERTHALAEVEHARTTVEAHKRADQAEAEQATIQAALDAARGPGGRRLVEHVAQLAKGRGESFMKAMAWAIEHDETAKVLAEVDRAERSN